MPRPSIALFLFFVATCSAVKQKDVIERPSMVQDALKSNKSIYYFGLGSNMSRKKLEGRSPDGTPIKILRMEAAIVPNHRLAFNLKGFPPLEPGMGSLEPTDSNNKALLKYQDDECHGALVKLTAENYERVMKSEGVGSGSNSQGGYEEVVVTCIPYNKWRRPVQAIALRARTPLPKDPCPSGRYMKILREGAQELGLRKEYQDFLRDHPVQQVPGWLRRIAVLNLVVTATLSFRFKLKFVSRIQSWLLFKVYVPSNGNSVSRCLSEVFTLLVIAPGAALGCLFYAIMKATGTIPPFLGRMMTIFGDNDDSQ
jgi:hypothetical protein